MSNQSNIKRTQRIRKKLKKVNKNRFRKNKDKSLKVAEVLAKKAIEKKITKVYFDRGKYKYHGRIKSFADALRKGGLIF